jgi:CO/xanthine dehydrogenase Mo-binding subunit
MLFDEPKSLAGHKGPTKGNPPGFRGAGEAGAVGVPPAVISAIVD